jgi:hypothetical protein
MLRVQLPPMDVGVNGAKALGLLVAGSTTARPGCEAETLMKVFGASPYGEYVILLLVSALGLPSQPARNVHTARC